MVSTDFGLTVKFDGNHRVEVTLPSSFKEKVCGMCGNYNGNAADDFLNPDGVLEPDSTSLGNSWQVSNHSRFVALRADLELSEKYQMSRESHATNQGLLSFLSVVLQEQAMTQSATRVISKSLPAVLSVVS